MKETNLNILSHEDINFIDGKGSTKLHKAVEENLIEKVACLLSEGANPNISTSRLPIAMYLAKSQEIVELLRSYGALEDHKLKSCSELRDIPLEEQPNQDLVKQIRSLIPVIMWDLQHEISLNANLQEILEHQWNNKDYSSKEIKQTCLYVLGRAKAWLKENFEKFASVKPDFYHYILLELALEEAKYPVTEVDEDILHTRGERGYDCHLETSTNMSIAIGELGIPGLETE